MEKWLKVKNNLIHIQTLIIPQIHTYRRARDLEEKKTPNFYEIHNFLQLVLLRFCFMCFCSFCLDKCVNFFLQIYNKNDKKSSIYSFAHQTKVFSNIFSILFSRIKIDVEYYFLKIRYGCMHLKKQKFCWKRKKSKA